MKAFVPMSRDEPSGSLEGQPELGGLLSSFRGYYRPSPDARLEAFRSGLLVFDTNALLDLYRFSSDARDEFLGLIRSIKERVFVPFQVASEFHRNRIDAVAGRTSEFEQHRSRLTEIRGQTRGFVRQLAQRAHAQQQQVTELIEAVDSALDDIGCFLDTVAAGYDLDPDSLAVSSSDPILDQLAEILEGRVGKEPSSETRAQDLKESQRRIDLSLPPGFADKGKGADAAGDYLWWAEVVRYATVVRPAAVIIISNDVRKGDWIYERRGFRIGPDPRLVAEMHDACDADLHWATTSEFLSDIPHALGAAAVSTSTLVEARVSRLIPDVVDAILAAVRDSSRPLVSSAVANAALVVDPSLTETAWAGSGSFRSFVDDYVPELRFVLPPTPGYIMDPEIHSDADIPGRGVTVSDNESALDAQSHADLGIQTPVEYFERLRETAQLPPEALERLQETAQLPPETIERLREITQLSPEDLETLKRFIE